jgi:hypothetical protein
VGLFACLLVTCFLARHFDENGNYVEDRNAHVGDEWLDGAEVFKGKPKVC